MSGEIIYQNQHQEAGFPNVAFIPNVPTYPATGMTYTFGQHYPQATMPSTNVQSTTGMIFDNGQYHPQVAIPNTCNLPSTGQSNYGGLIKNKSRGHDDSSNC